MPNEPILIRNTREIHGMIKNSKQPKMGITPDNMPQNPNSLLSLTK